MSGEMDDLERLRAELEAATPEPSAGSRIINRAGAQMNFREFHARRQGSAAETRLTPEDRAKRPHIGVRQMISRLTSKAILGATTAVAALGIVVIGPAFMTGPDDATSPSTLAPAAIRVAPAEPQASMELAPMAAETRGVAAVRAPMAKMAPQSLAGDMTASGMAATSFQAMTPSQPEIWPAPVYEADSEAFANEDENPLKVTAEEPVSTFSIDVDTAAWSVMRQSLSMGQLPPKDAVRVEELVNYFPYDYPAPEAGEGPFAADVAVFDTPWNEGTKLVRIGLQGEMPALDDRPPLNLVFLIDTSGSMQDPNKLPLLKTSLKMALGKLRAEDQVAIVAYAGSAGLVLEPTSAIEYETIVAALDALEAGGGTNGQGGLEQAYATAAGMMGEGEIGRILLATDGDFNVGLSGIDELKDFISDRRDTGTYLSVLGFGRGNLDDATMQVLAQNGNGQAAYIDTIHEAQKVLVDQLTGALFPIANDVKVQVEWNPAEVAEYRLIGYETRALKREDFANDKVDAGEIGGGHSVTALYEVTPVGSEARLTEPLRCGAPEGDEGADELRLMPEPELGYLRLRWKAPGEAKSKLMEMAIPVDADKPDEEARFAAAVAGFGQLLRGSDYVDGWGYSDAASLASGALGDDPFGYRAEAVRLMRLAGTLSR